MSFICTRQCIFLSKYVIFTTSPTISFYNILLECCLVTVVMVTQLLACEIADVFWAIHISPLCKPIATKPTAFFVSFRSLSPLIWFGMIHLWPLFDLQYIILYLDPQTGLSIPYLSRAVIYKSSNIHHARYGIMWPSFLGPTKMNIAVKALVLAILVSHYW